MCEAEKELDEYYAIIGKMEIENMNKAPKTGVKSSNTCDSHLLHSTLEI